MVFQPSQEKILLLPGQRDRRQKLARVFGCRQGVSEERCPQRPLTERTTPPTAKRTAKCVGYPADRVVALLVLKPPALPCPSLERVGDFPALGLLPGFAPATSRTLPVTSLRCSPSQSDAAIYPPVAGNLRVEVAQEVRVQRMVGEATRKNPLFDPQHSLRQKRSQLRVTQDSEGSFEVTRGAFAR